MRMMRNLFGIAALFTALAASAHAQTVAFNGIGSSAQFLELGQAAGSPNSTDPNFPGFAGPFGLDAVCVWSDSTGAFQATDPNGQTEVGNFWVAWTTGGRGGTCSAPASGYSVYSYLQTDSTVGDRCYFNHCTIGTNSSSPTTISTSHLIFPTGSPVTEQTNLNSAVWTTLTTAPNNVVNAAGTDIRPEDAAFATERATTGCGDAVASSNYEGLGYTSEGTPIHSEYSGSTFHVTDFTFNATSSFSVTPLGAVPIVVIVNPSDTSGFGSSSFTNISRADLSNYLDGAWGNTSHVVSGSNALTTVVVREPLSGTYNTMEYAVPNTTSRYVSQDVGLNQISAGGQQACDTEGNPINPLNIENPDGGYRNRAIGTGQEVSVVLTLPPTNSGSPQETNTLGYSFWSTANFRNATSSNAKYLQVDGFDPLIDSYTTSMGHLPTASNGLLGDVTFNSLKNGQYPIWSMLRIVSANPAPTAVTALANASQAFVQGSTEPDFVPISAINVLHSHFTPPGITYPSTATPPAPPVPNNGGSCGTEAGGDVGGVILSAPSCSSTNMRM